MPEIHFAKSITFAGKEYFAADGTYIILFKGMESIFNIFQFKITTEINVYIYV